MKRTTLITGFLLICLWLTACGASGQSAPAQAAQSSGSTAVSGNAERQMTEATKLALGTFKLDKTDYPIDATQAAQLLFLWKGMRDLSQGQSVANEEIQGLIKQIRETLTPEQRQAIEAMNLSYQDIAATSQEFGLDLGGNGRQSGEFSPEAQATFQSARQSGGGFGGGIPGAGGGGMRSPGAGIPGVSGAPQSGATNNTGSSQTRGSGSAFQKMGISPAMIQAVIRFLQTRL